MSKLIELFQSAATAADIIASWKSLKDIPDLKQEEMEIVGQRATELNNKALSLLIFRFAKSGTQNTALFSGIKPHLNEAYNLHSLMRKAFKAQSQENNLGLDFCFTSELHSPIDVALLLFFMSPQEVNLAQDYLVEELQQETRAIKNLCIGDVNQLLDASEKLKCLVNTAKTPLGPQNAGIVPIL